MAEGPSAITILDTHVWIWMVAGEVGRLSATAKRQIEGDAQRGLLRVSAISVWEVAMLEAKGRLTLAVPIDEWVRQALRAPGLMPEELTPAILIESTRLPGGPHADPADRMLMASARVMGGRLATCDSGILAYGESGHLSVLDCRP